MAKAKAKAEAEAKAKVKTRVKGKGKGKGTGKDEGMGGFHRADPFVIFCLLQDPPRENSGH